MVEFVLLCTCTTLTKPRVVREQLDKLRTHDWLGCDSVGAPNGKDNLPVVINDVSQVTPRVRDKVGSIST